jgi:hypothetical protein
LGVVSETPNPREAQPRTAQEREWWAEFEAAARRPLAQRMRYAFIKTYKPVMDDAPYRVFETMQDYRDWCARELPDWLGYGAFECLSFTSRGPSPHTGRRER